MIKWCQAGWLLLFVSSAECFDHLSYCFWKCRWGMSGWLHGKSQWRLVCWLWRKFFSLRIFTQMKKTGRISSVELPVFTFVVFCNSCRPIFLPPLPAPPRPGEVVKTSLPTLSCPHIIVLILLDSSWDRKSSCYLVSSLIQITGLRIRIEASFPREDKRCPQVFALHLRQFSCTSVVSFKILKSQEVFTNPEWVRSEERSFCRQGSTTRSDGR